MAEPNIKPEPGNPIIDNVQGLIGKPVERVDGPLKVAGRATYSYEYRGAGQALYGFIVESRMARSRLTDIRTEAAERAPGVVMVLTHRNAPKLSEPHPVVTPNRFSRPEPFLYSADVRYFGDPIALVIANTFEEARHAASLIDASYEPNDSARFDLERHIGDAFQPEKVNADLKAQVGAGDVNQAMAGAPVKVEAEYVVPYRHNNPMEPHATIAQWSGDTVVIYSGQQIPKPAQETIAKTFMIPAEKVRVFTPYIGGGFGSKVPVHSQAILAALGAKAVQRPVKVALARQQMFANTNHRPRGIQRMRLGAERDGTLLAFAHEVVMQSSSHDEFVEQAAAFGRSMYAAPNRIHNHQAVALDLPAPDIMRAPGEEPGSYAVECAMDELATALNMDPVALRIKNEPKEDPIERKPFGSRMLVQCMEEGARRFGWENRARPAGSRSDGRLLIGMGVASATFPTNLRPSSATVRYNADGTAVARLDMTDIGTGTYTVLSQVLAESLGLPMEKVRVELGDTAFPPAAGSGGSFGAASSATGIMMACEKLKRQLEEASSLEPGVPLATLIARRFPRGLEAIDGFTTVSEEAKAHSNHAYGAQFAEVAVDRDTGEIRVRRMLGVFAAGRILNRQTARSQLIGGMIMGLGSALMEESYLDTRDGSFVNRDLAEYHIPVNADAVEIDAIMLDEMEPHANPLGIKGLGEIGIVGSGAAVVNAVYNATGVRVRDLPVTLDKLLPQLRQS